MFHAGEEQGLLYVTMRYVDGTDLRAILRAEGRLAPERAVRVVGDVAGALDEAHRRGLVTGTSSRGTCSLTARDGVERAFLSDFGLTKERAAPSELTGTGLAIGTADCIAPEQARARTRRPRRRVRPRPRPLPGPHGAGPLQLDSDVREDVGAHHRPPPALLDVRPNTSAELGAVLARAMAKDPGSPSTAGSSRATRSPP